MKTFWLTIRFYPKAKKNICDPGVYRPRAESQLSMPPDSYFLKNTHMTTIENHQNSLFNQYYNNSSSVSK
jgi:hypothetical protein